MSSPSTWLDSHRPLARRSLALAAALGEFAGLLLLVQTALLVEIGNRVIFRHEKPGALAMLFVWLAAVIVLRALLAWASRRASYSCAARVKQAVRRELSDRLVRIGPVALSATPAGELATLFVDGTEALEGYFAKYLPQRAVATLLPFTVLAVVFPLDWISGVILVVTALFLPITMIVIGEEAHERNRRLWSKLARLSGRFLDAMTGLTTLRMFGAGRRETLVIERESEEYRSATMSVMRIAFLSSFMLELISTVSIAIVAVVSGFRLLAGSMHFAPGYFILLAAPEYFLTLRMLGTFYHARMESVSAAERLAAFLEPRDARDAADGARDAAGVPRTAERRRSGALAIELDGVSVSYGERPALDRVSLSVEPGERVALVGPSGAGKSTLLALLLGFVDSTGGRLRVGERTEEGALDWDALRRRIAWLPQRPTLFAGTIRDNIALGRPGATLAEIERAAQSAFADEFIERLHNRYDTVVGERGVGLSGGEIQRIALARLFLRRADLVLLDEPTAHLDLAASDHVWAAAERLARDATMLLVTHRIEEIRGVDRIVSLDRGRLSCEEAPR